MKKGKWKDVFDAAEHSDLEAVKSFVENEKEEDLLGSTDDQGKSIALIAARKNDSSILKYALEMNNSLLLYSEHSGYNIIEHAIDNNALDIVKYLVEHHFWDIHHRNKPSLGNTPIHHATKMRRFNILKYFIEEKKGDVNVRNDLDDPPVFLAVEKSYMEIIRYLVEKHKADLTLTNSQNENILFVATKSGHLNVIHYVLEERKIPLDINWTDNLHRTVLYLAVKRKYPRIIKYLVEAKSADVNIADNAWNTPLHIAADVDNYDVCKYLVDHGANCKVKDKAGYTPMENADDEELIQYFQEVIRERSRRSVNSLSPHAEYSPPSGLAATGSVSRTMISDEKKMRGIFVKNVINSDFISFLMVVDTVLQYFKGSGYQGPKHDSLQSPLEILEARVDPIAVDAILTLPNE